MNIDTVAVILSEMLKESRKDDIAKGEFYKLPNDYAERIVKLFSIPNVACSCCGKNAPEICGSCVSDIAQETGDAARMSR